MLVCVLPNNIARETAGAARIRLSLRPLLEGENRSKARAHRAARMRSRIRSTRIAL